MVFFRPGTPHGFSAVFPLATPSVRTFNNLFSGSTVWTKMFSFRSNNEGIPLNLAKVPLVATISQLKCTALARADSILND